jgi:hypothetical protein
VSINGGNLLFWKLHRSDDQYQSLWRMYCFALPGATASLL